ncbi:MAG: tRNA (cytidine(34)-2'-O)-methyltransferase [Leptospirales bacterium]|nr:tRNA (cytidine(34)-2'-O)-methyltransferase [Leptospirales bacterium]
MHIALYKPEIPPNTGNIGRLCHCTGSRLHIIDRPAFSLDEAAVRRAGLDYWEQLPLMLHADWQSFLQWKEGEAKPGRIAAFSRFASQVYSDFEYHEADILLFGQESSGLPAEIVEALGRRQDASLLRIPVSANCRSLNLANAASLALYEALRQQNFQGLDLSLQDRT